MLTTKTQNLEENVPVWLRCTAACGTGGGIGPRTGTWWAWFGGIPDAVETGSMSQDITIPAGTNGVYRWGTGQAKLNAAFAYGSLGLTDVTKKLAGGTQALQRTIQADYGIPIDAAAIVDFSGFKKVIDTLGGVTLCVDEQTT